MSLLSREYEDKVSMSKGFDQQPEEIIYCGVQWTGWEWRAQLKVDSRNNKVIRSQGRFSSQIDAAREFVRMAKLHRGDTLEVDGRGGRLKPKYRLMSPTELTNLIEQSGRERAAQLHS
jgi:hypothetical protein